MGRGTKENLQFSLGNTAFGWCLPRHAGQLQDLADSAQCFRGSRIRRVDCQSTLVLLDRLLSLTGVFKCLAQLEMYIHKAWIEDQSILKTLCCAIWLSIQHVRPAKIEVPLCHFRKLGNCMLQQLDPGREVARLAGRNPHVHVTAGLEGPFFMNANVA